MGIIYQYFCFNQTPIKQINLKKKVYIIKLAIHNVIIVI